MNALIKEKGGTFSLNKSEPIHRWYPYVEGYSSCLIAEELSLITICFIEKGLSYDFTLVLMIAKRSLRKLTN